MKKFLAILTVMTMVLTTLVVPTVAFADGEENDNLEVSVDITQYQDACNKFFEDVLNEDGETLTVKSIEPTRLEDLDIILKSIDEQVPEELTLQYYPVVENNFNTLELALILQVERESEEPGPPIEIPVDSRQVAVDYQYNPDIQAKVAALIDNLDMADSEFTISDMELINYWYNIYSNESSEGSSMEGTIINYSSEFKKAIDTYNFYISIGAGDPPTYFSFEEGHVALIYDDTFYGIIPRVAARGEHVIYVKEDAEDLASAAEERIERYLNDKADVTITENSTTVSEAYDNLFNSFIAFASEEADRMEENIQQFKERIDEFKAVIEQLKAALNDPGATDADKEVLNNEINRQLEQVNWHQDEINSLEESIKEFNESTLPQMTNDYKAKIKFLEDIKDEHPNLSTFTLEINGMTQNIIIVPDGEKPDPAFITKDLETDVVISTGSSEVPLDAMIEAAPQEECNDVLVNDYDVDADDQITYDLKVNSKTLARAVSNSTNGYITKLENGLFEVVVPIKDKNWEGKRIVAYYVDKQGNVETHEVTVKDGKATFTTDHFSEYTLAPVSDTTSPTPGTPGASGGSTTPDSSVNTGDDFSAIPLIAIMAIALAGVAVVIFRRRTVK